MNKEIKYTNDGKKVVVIGSLNSQEKIVQEIFIVDGSEIPSGEHFVVKSLHDAPAVSWMEKRLKDLNERFDREQKEWDRKIDEQSKRLREKSKELSKKLEYTCKVLANVSEDSFNLIVNLLTHQIKWVVIDNYTPEIKSMDEFNKIYDYDSLRLISIFGQDDGTLNCYQGRWSDNSGGHTQFYPFTDYDDAFEKFKELLIQATVTDTSIKIAQQHNIELDKEKLSKYWRDKKESIEKNIASYTASIEKWNEELSKVNVTNPLNS